MPVSRARRSADMSSPEMRNWELSRVPSMSRARRRMGGVTTFDFTIAPGPASVETVRRSGLNFTCYIALAHGNLQCIPESLELSVGGAGDHSLYPAPARYLLAVHHSVSGSSGRRNLPSGGSPAGFRTSPPVVQSLPQKKTHS